MMWPRWILSLLDIKGRNKWAYNSICKENWDKNKYWLSSIFPVSIYVSWIMKVYIELAKIEECWSSIKHVSNYVDKADSYCCVLGEPPTYYVILRMFGGGKDD